MPDGGSSRTRRTRTLPASPCRELCTRPSRARGSSRGTTSPLTSGPSRAGRWPWNPDEWDDGYADSFAFGTSGNVNDTGVKGVQRQSKIDQTGILDRNTFEVLRTSLVPEGLSHAGEPLFDAVALELLKSKPSTRGELALSDYCRRSIANEPKIHYSQARPMTHLGDPPEGGFTTDCSGHSRSCYYEADWPDPNKNGYNGYGWTGELVDNPKVKPPYKVGDLALYGTSTGNTTHCCTCYVAGDAWSSTWCSHGSEQGPNAVSLNTGTISFASSGRRSKTMPRGTSPEVLQG